MVVLVGIAAWSLRAVNEFVHVNATIIGRSVPAVRLETSLRESMLSLLRIESRWAVLRDPGYAVLWNERADRAAEDLERLRTLITTPEEARYLRKSRDAFLLYRDLVLAEHEVGPGSRPSGPAARFVASRADAALGRLLDATYGALERSHDDARTLEER